MNGTPGVALRRRGRYIPVMNGPDRHDLITREHLGFALARQPAGLRGGSADVRGSLAWLGRSLAVKLGLVAMLEVAVVGGLGVLF